MRLKSSRTDFYRIFPILLGFLVFHQLISSSYNPDIYLRVKETETSTTPPNKTNRQADKQANKKKTAKTTSKPLP